MKKTLEYYRSLPYSRRAEGVHEGGERPYWVVWIEELSGCKTDGATFAEAMVNLDAAFDDYIEAKLEFGSEIPLPTKAQPEVSEVRLDEISMEHVFEFVAPDDKAYAPTPPPNLWSPASAEWGGHEALTTTGRAVDMVS